MDRTEHILDEQMIQDLLAGRLDPAAARRLADHLDGSCERCESLLAERHRVDLLEGRVDAALTRLAPIRPEERGNDLEFARILRATRGGAGRPAARVARFAALAAALALVAGVTVQVYRDTGPGEQAAWDGVKGATPRGVPVRLRFAVARGAGATAEIERGANGMQVDSAASLAFQIEVGGPADVALVRVGPDGAAEVLFRQQIRGARSFDVMVSGRPAAFPLEGVSGRQQFVVLATAGQLSDDAIAAAQREVAAAGARALSSDRLAELGVSADVVEVTVR